MKALLAVLILPTSQLIAETGSSIELSPQNRREAKALLEAYNGFTEVNESLPLDNWSSACKDSACAFNYETERENFGILVNYKDRASLRERTVSGFYVDPNGVDLPDDTSFPRAVWLENGALGSPIDARNTGIIAAKIKKNMGAILNIKGELAKNASECRRTGDRVYCAINFKKNGQTQGIAVEGWIFESEDSISAIHALENPGKAVRIP